MSNEQKERTLDDIEEKIYDFEALEPEIWFEVGELLTAAKKLLGHGKLEKWFDGCKFSFCRATRANRMAYYRDMLGRRDFARTVNLAKLRARMKGQASGFKDLINIDKLSNFKDQESRRRLEQLFRGERSEKDPAVLEVFEHEKKLELFRATRKGEMDFLQNLESVIVAAEKFVQDPENLTVKHDDQKQLKEMIENARMAFNEINHFINSKSVEPEPLSQIDD